MAVPPQKSPAGGALAVRRQLDGRLAAPLAAAVIVAAFAVIAVRNSFVYPPIGGYDAAEHIAYARSLIEQGELPYKAGAFYTPPLWYALAGTAMKLGGELGMDEPERLGQLLNALLVTATCVLLLLLARTLFPGRAVVALGSLAFFVACPTTLRMATMFHPQALVLFLSTAALLVVARMVSRRSYAIPAAALAGVLLGAAELVRSVALWSVGVALIVMLVAVVVDRKRRRRAAAAFAVVLALAVVVPLPWYVYLQDTYGYAVFGRPPTVEQPALPPPPPPASPQPTAPQPTAPPPPPAASPPPRGVIPPGRPPAAFFVRVGLPEVLTKPHRSRLERGFWPVLYADTWGDAFGAWTWGPTRDPLSVAVERRLSLQSWVGLPLTFLAGAGWLGLAALALRRLRSRSELLLVVGMPAAALAGLLYYSVRSYEPDLDFIKGMFALTAVPFWALGFGFAADGLWHRLPRLAVLALAFVLAACVVVSLEFGIA